MNKAKKFKCKICGEKQSFRKLYAQSEKPKDIRMLVMNYNFEKRQADAHRNDTLMNREPEEEHQREALAQAPEQPPRTQVTSMWAEFVPETKAVPMDEESDGSDDGQYTTVAPERVRKRQGRGKRRKPVPSRRHDHRAEEDEPAAQQARKHLKNSRATQVHSRLEQQQEQQRQAPREYGARHRQRPAAPSQEPYPVGPVVVRTPVHHHHQQQQQQQQQPSPRRNGDRGGGLSFATVASAVSPEEPLCLAPDPANDLPGPVAQPGPVKSNSKWSDYC
jgi:hypothetical protein